MVTLEFYPNYVHYKVLNKIAAVAIYGRTVDHKQILLFDKSYQPYFFVVQKETADAQDLMRELRTVSITTLESEYRVLRVEQVKRWIQGHDVNVLKVSVNVPKAVGPISKQISEHINVEMVLEHEVEYPRKYLIDKNITISSLCQATGELGHYRTRAQLVMVIDSIEQLDEETLNQRVMSLSVSKTVKEDGTVDFSVPITAVGLYSRGFQKVLTWKKFRTNRTDVEFVNSENALIIRLCEIIEHFRPDTLVGFASGVQDFPYILARAKKYGVNVDFSLDFGKPFVGKESVYFTGINHIDMQLFSRKFINYEPMGIYDMPNISYYLTRFTSAFTPARDVHSIPKMHDAEQGGETIELLTKAQAILSQYEQWITVIQEVAKLTGQLHTFAAQTKIRDVFRGNMQGELSYRNILVTARKNPERQIKPISNGQKACVYGESIVCDLSQVYAHLAAEHEKGVVADILESMFSRKQRIRDMLKSRYENTLKVRVRLINELLSTAKDELCKWQDVTETDEAYLEWSRMFTEHLRKENVRIVANDKTFYILSPAGSMTEAAQSLIRRFPMLYGCLKLFRSAVIAPARLIALKDVSGIIYINRNFKQFLRSQPPITYEVFSRAIGIAFSSPDPARIVQDICAEVQKVVSGQYDNEQFALQISGHEGLVRTTDGGYEKPSGVISIDYDFYFKNCIWAALEPILLAFGYDATACNYNQEQPTLNEFLQKNS